MGNALNIFPYRKCECGEIATIFLKFKGPISQNFDTNSETWKNFNEITNLSTGYSLFPTDAMHITTHLCRMCYFKFRLREAWITNHEAYKNWVVEEKDRAKGFTYK